jgi:hypothetical protein
MMRSTRFGGFGLFVLCAAIACSSGGGTVAPVQDDTSFAGPFPVTISAYSGDAMEPFLTRDGLHLLFNNRNGPTDSTDLHIAARVNDSTFTYLGKLTALNSTALDAVPAGATDGTLYFVSLRAYDSTFSTLFTSTLTGASASPPARVASISTGGGGLLDFDVDVSADGQSLIVARGRFAGGALPVEADLKSFSRSGGGFVDTPAGESIFAAINTAALEYAPALTANALELCFTRFDPADQPILMVSRRAAPTDAWDAPRRIRGPVGLIEAGTWSPDARTLYYHALVNGRYVIRRLTR